MINLQITQYNAIDGVIWDNFVKENNMGYFENTTNFIDGWSTIIKSEKYGGDNISFAISYNDTILGVFPLYIVYNKKNSSLSMLGGPVLKDGITKKQISNIQRFFIKYIDEIIKEHNVKKFISKLSPLAPAYAPDTREYVMNPLIYFGFRNTTTCASLIDLKNLSEEEIFKNFSETTRQEIRKIKAKSDIYSIREAKPIQEDLDAYYDMHCETYLRTGVKPFHKKFFEKFFMKILPENQCRITFLCKDGEPVAANITTFYKNNASYWANCSKTDKENGLNKILLYNQIIQAKRDGAKYFDVGTIFPYERNGKLKGLNDFKSSFGGFPYPRFYGEYVKEGVDTEKHIVFKVLGIKLSFKKKNT